ncbi:MAG: acyltransferase, partial [Candidatus Melainabacteria bacterium]|nr:acyltransferase [Candidatus Melainabacteria bacterium]
FFFVLSGFILCYIYPELPDHKGKVMFLAKRFARIWPLHFSIFLLRYLITPAALMTFHGPFPKFLVLLTNLTMVHAWIPFYQFYFSYNATSWTISTEFFFYLLFPFLLVWMKRSVALTMLGAALITCAFIALTNYLNLPVYSFETTSVRAMLYINPLPRILEFVCGMATALVFRKHVLSLGKVSGTALELACAALTIYLMTQTEQIATALSSFLHLGVAGQFWLTYSGVPLAAFSLLIYVMACNRGLLSALLSAPALVLLGNISYAVYLAHHPLLVYHDLFLSQYRGNVAFLLYCALLLSVSHILYNLVEVPFRKVFVNTVSEVVNETDDAPVDRVRAKEPVLAKLTKLVSRSTVALRHSLPSPGKVKSKGTIKTVMELGALAVLLLMCHPPLDRMNASIAEDGKRDAQLVGEAKAGDELTCKAVSIDPEKGKISIVWRSDRSQKIDQFICVQLLDDVGNKRYEQLIKISPRSEHSQKGDTWKESIDIQANKFENVTKLGIIVTRLDQKYLTISGERTDMDGKRLLVPLKPAVAGSSKESI